MEFSSRPSDPDDDFYLTVCFVCEEVAKPGQTHMRNYGGTVCFSCRQFFRRAHQAGKITSMICKNDGQCHITVKNRRKCQTCRYKQCLVAGMCPDSVLSEDQKKARFQRMIRKREAASTIFSNTIRVNIDESSVHKLKRPSREPQVLMPVIKLAKFDHDLEPSVISISNTIVKISQGSPKKRLQIHTNHDFTNKNRCTIMPLDEEVIITVSWPEPLMSKVKEILHLYNSAMEKYGLEGHIQLNKFVPQYISKFSKAFCDFANSCRFFILHFDTSSVQ